MKAEICHRLVCVHDCFFRCQATLSSWMPEPCEVIWEGTIPTDCTVRTFDFFFCLFHLFLVGLVFCPSRSTCCWSGSRRRVIQSCCISWEENHSVRKSDSHPEWICHQVPAGITLIVPAVRQCFNWSPAMLFVFLPQLIHQPFCSRFFFFFW